MTIKHFERLQISKEVMKDGIVFIWVEKELIADLVTLMETKDFEYVESLCWIMLDEPKMHQVEKNNTIDIDEAIVKEGS
jgi:hypothetical protein